MGGGLYTDYSQMSAAGSTFTANTSAYQGGGILCSYTVGFGAQLSHCVINNNSAGGDGGGVDFMWFAMPKISNCTIVNNHAQGYGGGIRFRQDCYGSVANCIIWNNDANQGQQISLAPDVYTDSVAISYTNLQGGVGEIYSSPQDAIGWGSGNIDIDPCFSDPCNGDYHLKSAAGRWDSNINDWVTDTSTSRGIDAGNPSFPLGDEPNGPNNVRIDMGCYGGTAEASKTPADWGLLSDLTNDGIVDWVDFAYLASDWLIPEDPWNHIEWPGNLNRSGIVDLADLELFTEDWLEQTIWHDQ
jgi:predicted outer membrane repeat protein